jgi:anthranilate phosphoribosyltransferase
MIQNILKQLRTGVPLSSADATQAISDILDGHTTPAQTGAFLMSLSQRGETVDEIVSFAKTLRARATTIQAPANSVDCCGTGGDHSGSYNISTAVAFVVAACGIPVAKHGNRAASSQSGAADVLEILGLNLDLSPERCEIALNKFGFCFLMAPKFHGSLKPLSALRKELGFRTIFNLLGPLANPANTHQQLLGVFDKSWVRPMAEALQKLGTTSALVVHGSDGMDEITLTGVTHCAQLKDGRITDFTLSPADFGLPTIQAEDILGGDATTNAKALIGLLEGTPSAYRDIVLANASATLVLCSKAEDYRQGVALAANAIDNGSALKTLNDYISFSKEASK